MKTPLLILQLSLQAFSLFPYIPLKKYEVEVFHRPDIPDNITNWKVFEDDQQVKNFTELKEDFENIQVYQKIMLAKSKGNSEVMQLKNNFIPKGLIPLEKLFYQNDIFKSSKIQVEEEEVESCNLGTVAMP